MTFVNSAVNLVLLWRNTGVYVLVFTALVALFMCFGIKYLFFSKKLRTAAEKIYFDCNEQTAASAEDEEDEDEEVSQENVIPKVRELESDERDCSNLLAYEDDKESTVDILKALGKLHGKLATAELRAKTKQMEQAMTKDQLREEREIKQKQLESIYALMKAEGNKFGLNDKVDLEEQMKLYAD